MEGPRDVIVVHGGCADGLTSAGLLLRRLPGAEVIATQPALLGETLARLAPDERVRRLVIADLSPQAADIDAILTHIADVRRRVPVTWLDHHAPQWTMDFENRLRALEVEVSVDRSETESGASLAAKWTQEKDPRVLRVADLIRLRDAWVEPHNEAARAWTLVATAREDYVQRLASGDLNGLEEEGQRLLAEKEASIARSLAAMRRHGPRVAFLWGEDDVSDVADRTFQRDPDVVFVLRFGPSRRVSVRSRPERPDAASLAQAFGGGGHAHAAGFTLKMPWLRRVMYRLTKTRSGAVRAVLAEAARRAT